jgi:stearoyl-CoA desaturase (delta-9 desaturase)
LTLEGPAAIWVPNHWQHHARSDQPGDVHSPYQYHGIPGQHWIVRCWLNLKGILWSETGWLFYEPQLPENKKDPFAGDTPIQRQRRNYGWIIAVSLVFPALVCGLGGLTVGGWQQMLVEAIDGFLIAGVVRIVVFLIFTGGINSVCHLIGRQVTLLLYEVGPDGKTRKKVCPSDGSRNVWWLAIFTFGEGYHALHHLFQRVAYHGWSKWAIDPSKWALILFEKLGWVWEVKKPPKHEVIELEVMLPPDSLIRPFSQAPDDDRTLQAA